MTTSENADAQVPRQSTLRHLSIPSKLTLTVVPLAAVALLASVFLLWRMDGIDVVTIVFAGFVGLAAVATLVAAFVVGRSVSRRISQITNATETIARKDLIDLLDALRTPDANLSLIAPLALDTDRADEVGDLARSVDGLHSSLIEVAGRQMEALRNGVSNIFVTLARRNSSLVDRQLAVLDELESREEDARVLGGYYRIDHLATRMRRNAESLLVLAGSEAPRVWSKPTEMSDVVRAAVGEVDEYQRIEVPALEQARLSGGSVSDISHLLAELLENALQFSPPSEPVRVTGLFGPGGYQITVSDRGVGMTDARLAELNRILEKPQALGLSVEPTLGIYVVSQLAHRHGVGVQLIRGLPGITARVTVPRNHLEVAEKVELRHWETEREHREAAAVSVTDYDDAATRDYILSQSAPRAPEHLEKRAIPSPAADGGGELIDLTDPEMSGDRATGRAPASLPIRNPGQAIADDDSSAPSSGPGEGAIGIKSALAAFDRGRRAAEEMDDKEDGS